MSACYSRRHESGAGFPFCVITHRENDLFGLQHIRNQVTLVSDFGIVTVGVKCALINLHLSSFTSLK
jgi:hypothetical protein